MKHMKRIERTFRGVNSARKAESRIKADIADALDCELSADIIASLKVRGKRKTANLPNEEYDNPVVNRGHEKKYGVRPKKKGYNRRSIRENPLTEDDFYDMSLDV